MPAPPEPWTGAWIDVDPPLAAEEDLLLALADRRGCRAGAVREELEGIDEAFDVDAVYLEP